MNTHSSTTSAYKLKPMMMEKNLNRNFLFESIFAAPFTVVASQHPRLIPAMVSPSIFTSLLNASNVVTVTCFDQNDPGRPQLQPLTYTKCRQAVQNIPMGEKALAPITFSRNPDAGFRVPHSWSYEDCVVIVDTVDDDAEETTTFAAVFKRAFDLAVECVIKPPHFGGRSRIGTSGMLDIVIIESTSRKSL